MKVDTLFVLAVLAFIAGYLLAVMR